MNLSQEDTFRHVPRFNYYTKNYTYLKKIDF